MSRRRHTPEQIIRKLAEGQKLLAGGMTVEEVCRQFGIAESTWARWLSQYGGMNADDAKRLKELEAENARLQGRLLRQRHDRVVLVAHAGRTARPAALADPGRTRQRDLRVPRDLPQPPAPALSAWHALTRRVRSSTRTNDSSLTGPTEPGAPQSLQATQGDSLLSGPARRFSSKINLSLANLTNANLSGGVCNFNRPHGGLNGQTPYERLRQKTTTPLA